MASLKIIEEMKDSLRLIRRPNSLFSLSSYQTFRHLDSASSDSQPGFEFS